jgi:serine/threonine protein kinase/tetratricopeptide (TPR) repeat protein
MTAPTLPRPADPDLELDGFVAAFEAAAASDPHADPAAYVPPADHPRHVEILAEVLRVDLELAWDRGERRRADNYRTRFPVLASYPSVLCGVFREEARLRTAADGDSDSKHPRTTIVPAVGVSDQMPGLGRVVAGFVLEAELGRGAFGRVFLGRQPDLADRPVAVKVSAKFPGEWKTLARLQHAHIVPVYSVHRHGRFHVACMPYLGRTTLADVIGQWRASTLNAGGGPTAPASGGEPPTPPRPPAATPIQPAPDHPSRLGWVLTVGARLAEALAHAHERGVLHRDIKPANVLLTDDGRPMLLDFNLAADAAEATTHDIGGTPRYMAPEQLAALATDRGAHSARSDVYALGLVLCELLAGRLPFDDPVGVRGDSLTELAGVRSRPLDPARLPAGISPAVASILSTALAPDPARRYPSAAALREDLERQLAHRPLAFAPERSAGERLAKWRRRHPRLSSWVTVTALAAVLVLAVVGGFLWRQRHFDGVAATNHLHRLSEVRREVRARLSTRGGPKAEYAEAAAECEAVLNGLPAPTDPAWQAHPLVRPLTATDRRTAAQLSTELRWLKAGADRLSGKSADDRDLLAAARAADKSGIEIRRDEVNDTAAGARKQLSAARAAARTESGRWEFWYRLGHLERRAGDLAAARAHFRLAADLADDSPWAVYHLGATALDAKEWKAAVAAFDEFITRRADVPEAYLNRAIARIRLNDLPGAITDLDRIELHADTLPRFYFTRAEAKRRNGDSKGADADRAAGLKAEPTDAVGWNARGEAKLTLTPPDAKGALADFERARTLDPDSPTTYQNLATVYGEHMNRPADAAKAWDEALDRFPGFAVGLGGRAVYLARQGKRDDARRDADAAVLADPSALVCYQAACAYLLTAKTEADRRTGMGLLRRALRGDPSWGAVMPTDPDLNSVWKSDDFRELVRAAGIIAAN